MKNIWILAQTENGETVTSEPVTSEKETTTKTKAPTDPNAGAKQQEQPGGGWMQLVFLGIIFVFLYFILFRGPKKKQQQHKKMVQNLKKNDRVQTIGGIFGTIVEIKDNEVVLKIDESNNTKIKVLSSAISRNISEGEKK